MEWQKLMSVFVVVLVPMIPAYVLYKTLPSDTIVTGPFKGLTINLRGAFAGYFIVLLVVVGFWTSQNRYDVWRVSGKVNVEDLDDKRGVLVTLVPPPEVQQNGYFSFNVLRTENANGEMEFPIVRFEQPTASAKPETEKYTTQEILGSDAAFPDDHPRKTHWWRKWIEYTDWIVIKEKPAIARTK